MAMYDEADRELIRHRLRAHMEKFGIGVPALQGKITAAAGRSPDQLPLSTLQRFVAAAVRKDKKAGKKSKPMRTNDSVVWMCHKFLLQVNDPDPVIEFGEANTRFLNLASGEKHLPPLAGRYQIKATPAGMLKKLSWITQHEFEHGELILEAQASFPFLKVTERVTDIGNKRLYLGATPGHWVSDGIAFLQPHAVAIVMRDRHNRFLKEYLVGQQSGALVGTATFPVLAESGEWIPGTYKISLEPLSEAAA